MKKVLNGVSYFGGLVTGSIILTMTAAMAYAIVQTELDRKRIYNGHK